MGILEDEFAARKKAQEKFDAELKAKTKTASEQQVATHQRVQEYYVDVVRPILKRFIDLLKKEAQVDETMIVSEAIHKEFLVLQRNRRYKILVREVMDTIKIDFIEGDKVHQLELSTAPDKVSTAESIEKQLVNIIHTRFPIRSL